jgi:hypothetical protein
MKSKKQAKQKNRPRNKQVDWKALDIVHPDAAGIDIGGKRTLGGHQPRPG